MTGPRFIALDGIDGSGKSSQIGPLVEWLRHRGCRVTTCRDPGSTPAGDAIRAAARASGFVERKVFTVSGQHFDFEQIDLVFVFLLLSPDSSSQEPGQLLPQKSCQNR